MLSDEDKFDLVMTIDHCRGIGVLVSVLEIDVNQSPLLRMAIEKEAELESLLKCLREECEDYRSPDEKGYTKNDDSPS
jgi:hypothetical protein